MINGDKLRSMSNEELAKFMPGETFGYHCPPGQKGKGCIGECEPCWLKYLNEEISDPILYTLMRGNEEVAYLYGDENDATALWLGDVRGYPSKEEALKAWEEKTNFRKE